VEEKEEMQSRIYGMKPGFLKVTPQGVQYFVTPRGNKTMAQDEILIALIYYQFLQFPEWTIIPQLLFPHVPFTGSRIQYDVTDDGASFN